MSSILAAIDHALIAATAPTDEVLRNLVAKLPRQLHTPEHRARAEQLEAEWHRAADRLRAHGADHERDKLVELALGNAEAARTGAPLRSADEVRSDFENNRKAARQAQLEIGSEVAKIFLAVAPGIADAIAGIAEQRLRAEQAEAAELAIPFRASSTCASMQAAAERLRRQVQKLDGADPRGIRPSAMLGPIGVLGEPPAAGGKIVSAIKQRLSGR